LPIEIYTYLEANYIFLCNYISLGRLGSSIQ
jgi:hypothetical protein